MDYPRIASLRRRLWPESLRRGPPRAERRWFRLRRLRAQNHRGLGGATLRHDSQGGWTLTGSWPIATEMGSRLRARDSAALATSVHLICRPRPEDAPIGDWADVLRELPVRVG